MLNTSTSLYPWISDLGDGRYRNPLIYADYSDPDVIQHEDKFYLVSSSFTCTPGLPILESTDLVNWKLINHALKNLPLARYGEFQSGGGVWAPSIRFHNGKFWIFFPLVEEGIFVVTASHPSEKWSEPRLLLEGKGLIDPCPFWDDDGEAYLVHAYAKSRSGLRDKIHVRPMAADASHVTGKGMVVFEDGGRHPYMEGPKVHKKGGFYYIFAPAGGVSQGWQVVLRSKNIYGPYEDKIVLEKGGTSINGPHQGALIEFSNGEDWFLHFQDADTYGRILHMQPVTWKEGWPFMGVDTDGNGVGEPVATWKKPSIPGEHSMAIPQTSDSFQSPRLGLQWQWNANHQDSWISLTQRPGCLRFFSQQKGNENLLHVPQLLLQKFPAPAFSVQTEVELCAVQDGEEAGLVIVGRASAALTLRKTPAGTKLVFQISGEERWASDFATPKIQLQVTVQETSLCTFAYFSENGWLEIPVVFKAEPAEWLGARIGILSLALHAEKAGYADFSHFHFS